MANTLLRLKALEIKRMQWDDKARGLKAGDMSGDITFDGENGSITLRLQPDQIASIFQVVAGAIVEHAKASAMGLIGEAMAEQARLVTQEKP